MITDDLRAEFHNRASMIVRGAQQPDSGWYNSPDDLVIVIEQELAAVYSMACHDCARVVCPLCAVHDRAGLRLRDLGIGTLHHITPEGHMHECKAAKIRKAISAGVFEDPIDGCA